MDCTVIGVVVCAAILGTAAGLTGALLVYAFIDWRSDRKKRIDNS